LQEQYAPDFDATPETDFDIKGRFYRPDITDASKRWIEKRGFDVNLLEMLKVKYLKYGISKPISDPNNKDLWMTISDRIIIPIYEKKTMISFEARDLYDKEHWIKKLGDKIDPETWAYKKVLYPRFSSVNTLYRFNELKKNEKLYVVEGLMDVISLLTHPLFQNSTCTFGAGITERQFYLLSQFKEICIIPNNDAPGLNVVRLFKNKPHIKNVTVLTLPKILKDVNDVLQKKTKHKSIDDLVKGQWTRWEKDLCNFDIDEYYRSL
jgi:DNA primase